MGAHHQAHIKANVIKAKTYGQCRNKEFYQALIDSFLIGEGESILSKKSWTLKDAFLTYLEDAKTNNKSVRLKPLTIKTISNSLKHISYLKMANVLISELNMNWYYEFISKSESCGRKGTPLSLNYISTHIKKLKRILRYSEDNGIIVHPAYKSSSFKAPQETASNIYLNEAELRSLRELKLKGEELSLNLTRDLFMIGAYTGLRVSDYNRLTKDNIKIFEGHQMFEVRSKKTNSVITIPIHPVIKDIINKYCNTPPPFQHEQVMNRNLKELGRLCQINEVIEVEITKGGNLTSCKKPKYEMIKTHTARRSFCTNAYLAKMDTLDIMALSGHKTESNFLKYIKVTRVERAKRISEHDFFKY